MKRVKKGSPCQGVVGVLGNFGLITGNDMLDFRKAQEEGTKQIKNALFIKTTDFARPMELSPTLFTY